MASRVLISFGLTLAQAKGAVSMANKPEPDLDFHNQVDSKEYAKIVVGFPRLLREHRLCDD